MDSSGWTDCNRLAIIRAPFGESTSRRPSFRRPRPKTRQTLWDLLHVQKDAALGLPDV